jgi:hypothetical protein
MTEDQITAAARALSNDNADICNVNREDNWMLYGDSFRETAKIALEAAFAQSEHVGWQPIETAPKTGRTLLLGYTNVLGKWRTVCGEWISQACIDEQWEEPDDAEAGWYETSAEADDVPNCWPITPTHWMPLPAAPTESK